MAYTLNDTAEAQHYNQFVWGSAAGSTLVTTNNNLYYVYGRGYGNRGFNQSMVDVDGWPAYNNPNLSSPNSVSRPYGTNPLTGANWSDEKGKLAAVEGPSAGDATGEVITAAQWIGLFSVINRCLTHQNATGGNITLTTRPMFGGTIRAISNVQDKLNLIASGTGYSRTVVSQTGIPNTASTYAWSVANNTFSNQTRTIDRTCIWNDGNQARWFFNAGGQIRVKVSATGSGDARSLEMTRLIDDLGTCTISYSANTGFTGNDSSVTEDKSKGYWTFTNGAAYTQLAKRSAVSGATYTNSYVTFQAKLSGDTTEGANGARFDFRFFAFSGYAGSGTLPAWATDGLNISIGIQIEVLDPVYSISPGSPLMEKTWTNPTLG